MPSIFHSLLSSSLIFVGSLLAPSINMPSAPHGPDDAGQQRPDGAGGPNPAPITVIACGDYRGSLYVGIGGARNSEPLYDSRADAIAAAMSNPLTFKEVAQAQDVFNTIHGGYICDFCPEVGGCDPQNLFSLISGPFPVQTSGGQKWQALTLYYARAQSGCGECLI